MRILFTITILSVLFLQANQELINKIKKNTMDNSLMLLQTINPEKAKELQELRNKLIEQKSKSGDVIFLFTSGSVPLNYIENFIVDGSFLNYYYGTKIVIVHRGIASNNYQQRVLKLKDNLFNYEHGGFFWKNYNKVIDPQIFKDLNVTQVPAYVYAKHKGDIYPSSTSVKYVLRGESSLRDFFNFIKNKEKKYESYSQTLSSD